MDGAYTDPAVRQAISESISQAEADRMRGDKIREELYGVKYATPTPSITVGTQVRLTGVVRSEKAQAKGDVMVDVGCHVSIPLGVGGMCICVPADALEVIRQPFKRGEVVWPTEGGEYDESWFLVSDEAEGKVLAVATDPEEYQHIVALDVDDYERRP